MEKITKELKSISKFMGFIGLYQVYNLITYFQDVANLDLSSADAMMQAVAPVVKVVGAAPYILSILVYLFLCVKGHKEANDPSPAKLHIILAIIWTIGSALSAIGSISALFEGVSVMKVISLLFTVASTVLLFFYSKYAKEIRTQE